MTENELLLLWGKTVKGKPDQYHPLLFHLLDVGNCARLLWDGCLSNNMKDRLAAALGLDPADQETARLAIIFLAAAHDIGKATPGFQFQDGTPLEWLHKLILAIPLEVPQRCENKPHNFVSTVELKGLLSGGGWTWGTAVYEATILSHITGAHHGTFPTAKTYTNWDEKVLGNAKWTQVRRELLDIVIPTLCGPNASFPKLPDWQDLGAIPLLAGLISVADWIGSSGHFAAAGRSKGTESVAAYQPKSLARAERALKDFGWRRLPKMPQERPDFAQFWGFEPNPLQQIIAAQSESANGPFLAIVEAPMGVGKTEAALWAMDAALSLGINDGFYFALPTQATSNAMHPRVKKYLEHRLTNHPYIPLHLVHGNAVFSDLVEVVWGSLLPIYSESDEKNGAAQASDTETGRVVAMEWFTGAKRPLLVPFGVGTIDQSLTAILQARHWFVRLFGLARKVVVFDEIHSYDSFMSSLLDTLLTWLHELDCSVVLLSATLPSSKRRELMAAWGARVLSLKEEAAYPRVTWCAGKDSASLPVSDPAEDEGGKTVTAGKIIQLRCRKVEQLQSELESALAEGGCAAVVCNTVKEAQALFTELRESLSHLIEPEHFYLIHARMPFGWRLARESDILRRFGKDGEETGSRPNRSIVIGTQVMEQSLDLDFDIMASFMAPSDLLLQRLGRLHRHLRPAASRHELTEPIFVLLCEGGTEDPEPPSFGRSEYVYEREVLLRTWLLWRGKPTLALPVDIEPLIEDTYEHSPVPPNEVWAKALDEAHGKAEKSRQSSLEHAKLVVIDLKNPAGNFKDPDELVDLTSRDLKDDESPEVAQALRAVTREGDPSVNVICLCRHDGQIYLPTDKCQADLSQPVKLGGELTGDEARKEAARLQPYSVPISSRGLFKALVAMPVPPAWRNAPFLRHCRALIFENTRVPVGDSILRLDADLGLEILKANDNE